MIIPMPNRYAYEMIFMVFMHAENNMYSSDLICMAIARNLSFKQYTLSTCLLICCRMSES